MVGKLGMKWRSSPAREEYRAKKKLETLAYKRWKNMHDRCYDINHPKYSRYGKRGIIVCPEWFSFEVYYKDTGDAPSGMTLDRIDNNGPYHPNNVRWVSHKIQQCNKERIGRLPGGVNRKPRVDQSVRVFVGRHELTLQQAAVALGCQRGTLVKRLRQHKKRYGTTEFQLSTLIQKRGT